MQAKHGLILFAVLSLLMMSFIFYNSLQGSKETHAQSDAIVDAVEPVVETLLEPEKGKEEIRESISFTVRKAAHFVEFAVLGICTGGFFAFLSRYKDQQYRAWTFLLCLAVACCDEVIQAFTGRTNSLKDVALDSVGSICGILLIFAVFHLLEESRGGEAPCPN